MANNYRGFLLQFGNQIFPNHYFLQYTSTPDRRMETDAERDNTGYLHRSTLPDGKTGLVFSVHRMELDDKIAMQQIFRSGLLNFTQRRYRVTYWNDETNDYDTGEFYMPDVQYTVEDADETTIYYQPITFELVEY